MKRTLIIVTALMVIHSLEEIVSYFLFAHPVGLPSLYVYIPGQVVLFSLLAFVLWKPKSKIALVAVGIILLYEIIHLVSAWQAGMYTPGLITAIPLIICIIPYWLKFFTNVRLKKI